MGIFISVPKTAECVIIALVYAAALLLILYRQSGVLQSAGYSGAKYFRWLKKRGNMALSRFVMLTLLCLMSCAVTALCFSFAGEYAALVSLVPFVLFFAVYLWADKKVALRSQSVRTPRFMRLQTVLFLVLAVVCYVLVTLLNFADAVWGNALFCALRYAPLALVPAFAPALLALSNCIAKIYEIPHSNKFIRRAKQKLERSHIKVIAVTGSYGKTSVKFILRHILSEKYRVLATPRSHNTPIGIALAVNGADLDGYDVFIAEMGARHRGDIAELCAVCPPDISLITGICGQHMETFCTFADIVKTKGEILSATKDRAIIADDCFELFAAFSCNMMRCDCVSDIECGCDGTRFTLTLGGKPQRVQTKLLGAHSANNIGLAAAAAYEAGMTAEEIAAAIPDIPYIEHRLQPIVSGGVTVIDDGYNSNVKGARAALDVLRLFGGRKIAVTPGLVELGVLEEEENAALGRNLVGLDYVILVGDTLVQFVRRGYDEAGGDGERAVTVPTLDAAKEKLAAYLREGDCVLFLNDLPDVY